MWRGFALSAKAKIVKNKTRAGSELEANTHGLFRSTYSIAGGSYYRADNACSLLVIRFAFLQEGLGEKKIAKERLS